MQVGVAAAGARRRLRFVKHDQLVNGIHNRVKAELLSEIRPTRDTLPGGLPLAPDPRQIATRIEGLGLPRGERVDPRATIRAAAHDVGRGPGNGATPMPRSRELPSISIDLTDPSPKGDETEGRDLEVLGTLGEGGMGRVYVARQHSLDREVAIKSLHPDAGEGARLALLHEGAVTGHLEHPGIIPVHALGVDVGSRPVLVMKRVEGVSWRELLRDPAHPLWSSRGGGDPSRRLDDHLEILMQVCNAVHFAHSRGIVHRDIKPDNVLVGRFADVYLADWGLAFRMRSAERPVFCGTPAYMAPEMVLGAPIDERTDVYLLGATLHEILTGEVRHRGSDARAVLAAAAASVPHAYCAEVPEALARIANKATSRYPADRHADAAELRQAVSGYLRHKSSMSLVTSAIDRLAALRAIGERDPDDAQVQRDIDRLVAEARFALAQALEEWGENAAAREAQRELDALLERRHARVARLERLARDEDPTRDARARLVGQVLLAVVGVGLSLDAFVRGVDYRPSVNELTLEGLAPVAAVAAGALAMRRRVLRTAFNRRATLCVAAIVAGIALGRALAARAGMTVPQMLVYDSMLAAVGAVVSAGSTFAALAWVGAAMAATAGACASWPAHAFFSFSVGTAASLLLVFVLTWPRRAPPASAERAS